MSKSTTRMLHIVKELTDFNYDIITAIDFISEAMNLCQTPTERDLFLELLHARLTAKHRSY